ncbi:MAG: hypothetical protein PWQ55_2566, partial [Chloroflexota bacterium]|nr:hypothetical protein [Chloroflexota bacterium]
LKVSLWLKMMNSGNLLFTEEDEVT